jgi:hypothetical protein
MGASLSSILVALVAFAITFGIVKLVTTVLRKRRAAEALQHAAQNQSRQVRRAQERRNSKR